MQTERELSSKETYVASQKRPIFIIERELLLKGNIYYLQTHMQTERELSSKQTYVTSQRDPYFLIFPLKWVLTGSAQEWTNRTLISHERTSVHFLVLPGSQLSFTEITEYTYISLI